jgi:hypothetical protein
MSTHRPRAGATGSAVRTAARAVEACYHPSLIIRDPIGLMRVHTSKLKGCAYRLGIRDMASHGSRATKQCTCLSNARVVSRLWSSRGRMGQDRTAPGPRSSNRTQPTSRCVSVFPVRISAHRDYRGEVSRGIIATIGIREVDFFCLEMRSCALDAIIWSHDHSRGSNAIC